MKLKKQAFTLVELIVTIIILMILGTISTLSLQGYSKSARDSARIFDINTIDKALSLFKLNSGYLPDPSGGKPITYLGAEVWTQGTLGDSVISNLKTLKNKFIDPLTGTEYTYSRLNTKNEFQIAGIIEGDNLMSNLIGKNAYAVSKRQALAYVKGNYNGETAKTSTGSKLYILAVPTIISGDLSDSDLLEIISKNKLVYKGYSNLPDSYKGTRFETLGDFDYSPSNPVVFTGSVDELYNNESKRLGAYKKLQDIYKNSVLANEKTYQTLLNIKLTSDEGRTYVEERVGKTINKNIKIFKRDDVFPTSCGYEDGSFDSLINGFNIEDSCLFSQNGNADWIVADGIGVGGSKGLKNNNISSSATTELIYNLGLEKPAKISFDIKTNLYSWSNFGFYINDVEYLFYSGNGSSDGGKNSVGHGNANSGYKTFTTPLLPKGDYEFKWFVNERYNYNAYVYLDNITTTCIGGGTGCGLAQNIEEGSTNPWDSFNFYGNTNLPWNISSKSSEVSNGSISIKNPEISSNYGNAYMKLSKVLTEPGKIKFDIKTDLYSWSNVTFRINGVEYLFYSGNGSSDQVHGLGWGNANAGFKTFESPLLPAGSYDFVWNVNKRYGNTAYMMLDNLEFTCMGGGVGCGFEENMEKGSTNPWDSFNFTGNIITPWLEVLGAGNITSGITALKNPRVPGNSNSEKTYLTLNKTLTSSKRLSIDIKTDLMLHSAVKLYINGDQKLNLVGYGPNYNSGFQNFTSEVLSPGDYDIVIEVHKRWAVNAFVWLDNLNFINP